MTVLAHSIGDSGHPATCPLRGRGGVLGPAAVGTGAAATPQHQTEPTEAPSWRVSAWET